LIENEIAEVVNFQCKDKLQVLELRKNKLIDCNGISNCPSLTEIYLAENEIADISGLKGLPNLKKLHLRANKITSLRSVPGLLALEYLNLRENQVADLDIDGLLWTPKLIYLNMQGNPIADEKGDDFKKEVLIKLHNQYGYISSDENPDTYYGY
jgi:Leucine-rich repeat (LRR) protein